MKNTTMNAGRIAIPDGTLAADAAAEERRKLREALLAGKEVNVTHSGNPKPASDMRPGESSALTIPSGKLAASMYWYENDPELFLEEQEAMHKAFPSFKLHKLADGRYSWVGTVRPTSVRENAAWTLQLVYDHNHPSSNNYGGSVRVYSISPDLEVLNRRLGGIPHLLQDSCGNIYMCTARREDVRTGYTSTSAASSLGWAIKWITVFELWLAGDVTTEEFQNHTF